MAALVYSNPVKVTKVFAYSEYGGGDMAFKTDAPVTGCEGGYWLRRTDPGFATLSAFLMTVYAGAITVTVVAHADELWSGSYQNYCRVDAIA